MNSKTTPKDFFMHFGALIALYLSVIALIDLSFGIVSKLLPDSLNNYWSADSVILPVSILIIMIPALYVIEWFIFRDIVKMKEKKEIWVRKWRIYTTLFLAALTMLIDLIVVLNTYLNGEISSRFIWKAVLLFVITALVFAYYVLARIGSISGPVKVWRIILASIGGVLVLAAIVVGFIVVGSPAKQRALRFDNQRVMDLDTIQSEIYGYIDNNNQLPNSLSDLDSNLSNPENDFIAPTDPETGAQYGYMVEGTSTYDLCATFDLPSSADPSGNTDDQIDPSTAGWNHGSGYVCFNKNESAAFNDSQADDSDF